MRRLVAGTLSLVLAAAIVMPLQAQETPEGAAAAAGAVAEDAAAAMQETGEDAAAAMQEAGEDAAAAMQEAGEDAAAALQEVTEAAEQAADEAAAADDDAGYGDSEWLWILGLAGAFIIVWFLLRRRKARRQAT